MSNDLGAIAKGIKDEILKWLPHFTGSAVLRQADNTWIIECEREALTRVRNFIDWKLCFQWFNIEVTHDAIEFTHSNEAIASRSWRLNDPRSLDHLRTMLLRFFGRQPAVTGGYEDQGHALDENNSESLV